MHTLHPKATWKIEAISGLCAFMIVTWLAHTYGQFITEAHNHATTEGHIRKQ